MIDRLSVLCFAGTYGLALLAEAARFVVRSTVRWYVAAGLMSLGWLVQTAFLANLAFKNPLILVTTSFESVMLLSWIVALIGLYLMVRSPKPVAVGIFVLPIVLGLVIVAGKFAPREPGWLDWGSRTAFWGTVHGVFLLGGAVFACVAFAAGVMYLVQNRRLKSKRASRIGLVLPSLEQSERINRGAITIAFPLLTFGLLIGMILSLTAHGTANGIEPAHTLRWTDPKVVSALLMWLVFAVLLHARFRPEMRGRSVMVLSIVAFAFLVFTWIGVDALRLPTAHARACDFDQRKDRNAVRLLALGVDHRSAPAAVREALAFDAAKYGRGLGLLARAFPGNEFVVLSTCNRVEIYVAGGPEQIPEAGALAEMLVQLHSVNAEVFSSHMVSYHDDLVVNHLFRVAASLESLVLGEGQILGQVREAYRTAVEHQTVGPVFHSVFQAALRVGKLVRERTGLDQGKLSIASVAVDLAKEVFDSFANKTVLVIGAGKMAELTLQHLKGLAPGEILVTNRNAERAAETAARWNGRAVPFERLDQAMIDADLVISTTAAVEPIVTLEQYVRVQRARRNRLSLILDIAFPRDFDPRIGGLDQVMLYHIDELQAQAEGNLLSRQKGIDPALQIIERETAVCCAQLRHQRDAGLLLQQLGNHADQIRQRELSALYSSRPELTEADREAIAHMAVRLQNQFLHHPRAAVRSAVTEPHHEPGHPHPVLTFIRQIFHLGEPSPISAKKTQVQEPTG